MTRRLITTLRKWRTRLVAGGVLLLSCETARPANNSVGLEFFENKIRPVFVEHCYSCHSAVAKKIRGALKLDSREDFLKGGTDGIIVVAGQPSKSPLIRAVRYENPELQMPPHKDGGKKLPDMVIADLVQWVSMGAPYPETPRAQIKTQPKSWAFAPIKNPPSPKVKNRAWPENSIDAYILAKIEAKGHQPSLPADRRTLIRRVTYDLTGLPPTPSEVDQFIADIAPDAFARVVDRLLASPAYGERWGRHWLDVVRYADTAGDTADYPVGLAWRYRNYVIDSLNADKPYDEFVREQIAGDIIAGNGPRPLYAERITATGFLAISRRFGFDSEKYHHLTLQDTLDTMGQTVLGISLGCARCHDHKFDAISMQDYYALYGIFESSRYAFPGSEQKPQMRSMVPLIPPQESQRAWRAHDQRVGALAGEVARQKGKVPTAVFRSLHDPDGDFETQKDAAGGSYGVIVPPWHSEGNVSVALSAQSPYKNIYTSGKYGATIAAGTNHYRLSLGLPPQLTSENAALLYLNLDFRTAAPDPAVTGKHRFWIGPREGSPVIELFLSSEALYVRREPDLEKLAAVASHQWHNLQLTLDLKNRTYSGSLSQPESSLPISQQAFANPGAAGMDRVQLDAEIPTRAAVPFLEIDHFALQPNPIAATTTHAPPLSDTLGTVATTPDTTNLTQTLSALLVNGPCGMTYGVVEGTPLDAHTQLRGEPSRPGAETPRGFIKALGGGALPPGTQGSGRYELAAWLTRPENPLTARVMVNRLWQHHFGQGLVGTPNDFGVRGTLPTHPELLDHLATRFLQNGWSIKTIHRLILLSATYQQSSSPQGQKTGASPLASFERRRLSAEELRDTILAVGQELDRAQGRDHPFPSPVTASFTQHSPFSAVYDHHQRSVYLMTQRIKRHPFLALFDGPDPNATTPDRRATTVPTQALFFLNSPFVHEMAGKCAAQLMTEHRETDPRIDNAWRLTVGRSPTAPELLEARTFLAYYTKELSDAGQAQGETIALSAYVRSLFGSNEFLHLD